MQELILHPTEATPVPVTICPPRKPRKPRARKGEGYAALTLTELREAVASRKIKVTTKHTKKELLVMLTTGQYMVPAAYARAAEARKAKAAA